MRLDQYQDLKYERPEPHLVQVDDLDAILGMGVFQKTDVKITVVKYKP